MTDADKKLYDKAEELTEEYLEKKSEEYVPNIKWHDFSSEDLREEMKLCYREGMKDGYKEGLKAKINATAISNCPVKDKWHDLRKDPNDLPTCDCETVTLHENGNKNIQKWKNGNWTNAIIIPVIAWCELPKFEEV